MSRVLAVARLEGRLAWRGGRLRLLAALAILLGVMATVDGVVRTMERRRDEATASEAMRRFWLDQGEKNPHSAAHFGMVVFAPTPPLAFFDPGLVPWLPSMTFLEAHKQNFLTGRPSRDETQPWPVGLSLAALLQLLGPLLVLALAFDSVARERADGRWTVLLASGLSPVELVWGRFLGLAALLTGVVVVVSVVPAVVGASMVGASVLQVGALVAIHWLSLLGWLAVVVALSALARTPRAALLGGLALWAALVVVAPRLAMAITEARLPVPALATVQARVEAGLRDGIDGHRPDERAEALKKEVLARHGVATPEELPVNLDAILMQAGEEHANEVFDLVLGELRTVLEAHQRQEVWLGLAAFPLALTHLSRMLAGTDLEAHHAFVVAAEHHRRLLVKLMNGAMERGSRTGDWEWKASASTWEQVPDFVPPPPTGGAGLPVAMAGLALGLLVGLGGLHLAGVRAGKAR